MESGIELSGMELQRAVCREEINYWILSEAELT